VGGGANVGYCFNNEGAIKVVSGAALGFYYTVINVDFTINGKTVIPGNGKNVSFAGVFVKLLGGASKNFDISYKLLLGSSHIPALDIDRGVKVAYSDNVAVRHSFGLGYTVLRKTGGNTKWKR